MINFSIFLPTRRRPLLVYRLLDSIIKTAHDITSIEIILYIDDDDTASHEIDITTLKIIKLIRPRGSSMGMIFKECYKASSGRYIMLMNDDVIFHSQGWDDRVIEAFSKFPDGIAFVYGNDMDQGEMVPTFPILSRKGCELMGGVCPTGYLNLHIESHIFDIFKQLKHYGHQRIVYLNDVFFEHLHYTVGKSEHDKTYVKKNPESDTQLFIELAEERNYIAKKISQYIEEKKNSRIKFPDEITYKNKIFYDGLPVVSMVVPVFCDNTDILCQCLDAITSVDSGQFFFEVIVVSNVPTELLPARLLNLEGKIKVVYNKEKPNLSKIFNQGAKEASGDNLIFISNLAVPKTGWMDALVKAGKMNCNVGVVGCKHINPINERIHHSGISFFLNGEGKLKITHIYRGVKADNPVVNRVREFQAVSGECMFINNDVFFKAGGFDETLECLQDIDLCLKVRRQGMKVIYTPEAVVYCCSDRVIDNCGNMLKNAALADLRLRGEIENDLERLLKEDGFYLHKTNRSILPPYQVMPLLKNNN